MSQLVLPDFDAPLPKVPFSEATATERGAVFTRREVVDFILDLAGYTPDQPLHRFRLLEPSFGDGDFLLPAVERLLAAYQDQAEDPRTIADDLADAVTAVEVHPESIRRTRAKLLGLMEAHGVGEPAARRLADAWLRESDFLLLDLPRTFTHVVGNPPYVRQERIPAALLAEYRARYETIYDRADLYVPFMERALSLLTEGGVLGFICSDRWMKNRYGGPLREFVARGFHLAYFVDMVNTQAFHSEVIAYPAITILKREAPGPTRVAHRPSLERESLAALARAMRAPEPCAESGVEEVGKVVRGKEPWMLRSFDRLEVIRRLEARFPTLEAAGCRVGIGVATGADGVFIGPYDALDVEPDRKLPLVKTKDIEDGTVRWRKLGVINPFAADGTLADLADYPRLARYLERHEELVRKRNVAQRNPGAWYRTIDRIHPELTHQPKLLIPDIKGEAHVVYEEGRLYPHHNLYYVTSRDWDLRALQAVLRSVVATLFVSAYSVRMRGGYLRFQAQYLRRIRLPLWESVPEPVRAALREAAVSGEREACDRAVFDLYQLTPEERTIIGESGDERA